MRTVIEIAIILPLALFIKSNTIELFKIPTGSMEPTLYGAQEMGHGFGDHILVLRCVYGFSSKVKIPLINKHLPLPEYHFNKVPGMRQPRVSDVVVFESPMDTRMDYIKRCAGTPGDRVGILNGRLLVNGSVMTNARPTLTVYYKNAGLLADRFYIVRDQVNSIPAASRELIKDAVRINGRPYRAVDQEVTRNLSSFNPITDAITSEIIVPPNHFFMLGDNSASSNDGRFWGFVPMDLIKGKAWVLYLPIKRIRMIE